MLSGQISVIHDALCREGLVPVSTDGDGTGMFTIKPVLEPTVVFFSARSTTELTIKSGSSA